MKQILFISSTEMSINWSHLFRKECPFVHHSRVKGLFQDSGNISETTAEKQRKEYEILSAFGKSEIYGRPYQNEKTETSWLIQ